MKNGTAYQKPFGREIFGRETVVQYIYPREEMAKEEIFPYFVMDGGAFNFANDVFGQVDGRDLLEKVMSDELFEVFRNGSDFNWERSFAYTGDTEFTKKYEWQIWPQRLYMILPLAHAFMKTGEARYARKWLETVRGWDQAHPYQEFDPELFYLDTDMVWRDMQVAWRTLSLLHSVFMLEDAPFTEEEWRYLYDFIRLHTNHLYIEAKDRLERQKVQNHVLQIGTGLVLAACLFPEFADAEEYLRIGKDVIRLNMRGIYADGGSEEDSPSYSHFIARLYLEAFLLLKNNGKAPLEGLEETVRAQYEWLYQSITPLGQAPRISDSYGMDARLDLERVGRLIDLKLPDKRGSVLFPESNYAILRQGDLTLYVDAVNIPRQWGHIHCGRPQILLFYRDFPILTDMGICSYDRWEFYAYVQRIEHHNVVFSPAVDRATLVQETGIRSFAEDQVTFTSHVTDDTGTDFLWTRTVSLNEDTVTIRDHVDSVKPMPWRAHLLFQRMDINTRDDRKMQALVGDDTLLNVYTEQPYFTDLAPVMNDRNRIDYGIVMECGAQGAAYDNTVKMEFLKR